MLELGFIRNNGSAIEIAAVILSGLLLMPSSGVWAQSEPAQPVSDEQRAAREAQERFNKVPDTKGSGPFAALKEEVSSLPNHVVYRPADLSKLGVKKLGVLAWGNGACSDDGASSRMHLLEIASHGYLAIASGTIKSGPGVEPTPPRPPRADGQLHPPATSAQQLIEAIDWALAENKRKDSPFFGRIDPSAVAIAGFSCGGLQALNVAGDKRLRTVIIQNSGIFSPEHAARLPSMDIGKDSLKKLHTPVLYILGGPKDIAYSNGMDDYAQIAHVPVAVANLDVGHGGTYMDENGGRAAKVAVAWLEWQMRGDEQAKQWFVGPNCRLCKDPEWTFEQKNLK
jgi:dienelactone hydrolase